MLQIDLRELVHGPVATTGELPPGDPLFAGLDFALAEPVRVTGRLQATGEGRFYWQSALRTVARGECRRCLVPVPVPVAAEVGVLFTQDAGTLGDPDSYPLARDATLIDLAPAIREELILAVPRYVECRAECRGLCPQCGQDLNAGPCGCAPARDPRWGALAALKGKLHD